MDVMAVKAACVGEAMAAQTGRLWDLLGLGLTGAGTDWDWDLLGLGLTGTHSDL